MMGKGVTRIIGTELKQACFLYRTLSKTISTDRPKEGKVTGYKRMNAGDNQVRQLLLT
jgi:hypothetical protein